jgi:hypothetical protein
MKYPKRLAMLAGAGAALMTATQLAAQPAADSLAGKSVQMIIGFGAGGGYDLWGRTVGRHIGRYLPGHLTVIPQNMPGAGSYAAASYIFNAAPKDGTVLGIIARDAALGPLSGATGARFDPTRFSWIGTPTRETNVCIAYHTAQVKTVRDLFDKPLILGDTGPGTGTRSYPKALNALLGMKFKLVGGFPASSDVFLAMERLDMLRDAFNATMGDAAFVAETKQSKLELDPQGGKQLAALIAKIYATPKAIVDRITALIK